VSAPLEVHRHSGAGFELPLPPGWERVEDADGCALIAIEPPRAEPHMRANVVVTVERVPPDEPFDAWADRSLAALEDSLREYRLIDRDGPRALGHYRHAEYGGVNLEQWLTLSGHWGYVVSCTTAALEYDDLCDLMQAIGAGLKVPS
jgi:hypothetical protein